VGDSVIVVGQAKTLRDLSGRIDQRKRLSTTLMVIDGVGMMDESEQRIVGAIEKVTRDKGTGEGT